MPSFQMLTFKPAMILFASFSAVSCSSLSHQKNSENENIKLEKLLKVKFNSRDLTLFSAIRSVSDAYTQFASNHYASSMQTSKNILFTPLLTPELYKFALSLYTMSSAFLLNEELESKEKMPTETFSFDSFQYEQCKELCSSIGWRVLVQENNFLFTPEGYENHLIRNDILTLSQKKIPHWFAINVLQQDTLESTEQSPKRQEQNQITDLALESFDSVPLEKALSFFLKGEFPNSVQELIAVSEETDDREILAAVSYWIGRNYEAMHNETQASNYFLLSGSTNPLGLYDSLSGQMLRTKSGKVSTANPSPFEQPWQKEIDIWIDYPKSSDFQNQDNHTIGNTKFFLSSTLKSSIFLASLIRLEKQFKHFLDYQNNMQYGENSIEKILLADHLRWLKEAWLNSAHTFESSPWSTELTEDIAWLLYANGNFLDSALFVSQSKDSFSLSSERNNFLYFVFYPRPYDVLLSRNKLKCPVDVDLIYAILRQEDFFAEKQNMESLNALTCRFGQLLDKYNGNIVYAITAYKTSPYFVEQLKKKASKIKDDVIFVEMIPDENIRSFVKNTLRNYYNIKWIYFDLK